MSAEDTRFDEIVANLSDLDDSANGVSVRLFNGNRVCLDTAEGTQMRDVLLGAYAGARADVKAAKDSGLVFSQGKAIANAMFTALEAHSPIKKGARIGVFGLGAIAIGDYMRADSKLFTEEHTLYGRVHGTTYGEVFSISPREAKRALLTDELIIQADAHDGGLLVIEDVVVCERKEPGLVMRRDRVAFVPIHPETLQFGSALTLPSNE